MLPPTQEYHRPHALQALAGGLEALGDGEVSDVRLTAEDRRFVRRLLALAELVLSDEGLMHLAGGAEDTAWRKRAAKETGSP